jgi:hypothetical protein
MKRIGAGLGLVAAMAGGATPGGAAPVRVFSTQTATAFEQGTLENVSLDAQGVLAVADRAERVAELGEPFAFSFAALPDGWAVGTGNDGKVLRVGRDGTVSVLLDAEEPVVFALWADADGTLFAGTSPDGKVYRIAGGRAEPFFDPEETYIWAIARGADGALWVATGTEGRLHRVSREGRGEVAFDSEETHLRSLLPIPGGELLIGTAPAGLVLRWSAAAGARTIHDSPLSEVVAFAGAPDGAAWAAVLASESSLLDAAPKQAAGGAKEGDEAEAEGAVVVVVEEEGAGGGTTGSRPPGARGPRSEILRILPGGPVETVWTSEAETVFALAADGRRLWAGTGLEGKLYLIEGDRARVEKDLEERQVVGLAAGEPGPTMLTTNAASVWRFVAGAARAGTYTSAALDAGQAARFGVFRWRGERPAGTRVEVAFRSGNSSEPDRTWSAWTAPAAGEEIAIGRLPAGRYVQYRLTLSATAAASPRVTATELSYRQENQRPKIERFSAMDPGQLLVPSGFNPAEQVFEPASPNREGIFTTLEPAVPREERTKTLWKRGWRTLRWKASDPNGDKLEARLEVRREAGPEAWLEIADGIDGDSHGFDATVLPDGLWRFRLTVDDESANDDGTALAAKQVSEPVVVDHSAPELRAARREGRGVRLAVYDAWSPLRVAEVSIDGSAWRPLAAADGLVDGRSEELVVEEIPEGAKLVLVRVGDAAFNDRAIDVLAELGR